MAALVGTLIIKVKAPTNVFRQPDAKAVCWGTSHEAGFD
jgi:hypothetical protein